MKKYSSYSLVAILMLALSSCFGDLDVTPIDPEAQTPANSYNTIDEYKAVLAKVYAGLAVTGQTGPAGNGDISGLDEGFSSYLRLYWKHQELTTDEAVVRWGDAGLSDFHFQNWTASNPLTAAMFSRIYYQVAVANEFIRESSDAKLGERLPAADQETAKVFRAEARFMRALSYWHALDMFGSVPFVTEEDKVGSFFPEQISRADLFAYIESELKEIEPLLENARANEYGRADKAAAWMLLSKLYLNAKVYTGTERWQDAATYSKKVMDAGYSLKQEYPYLFMADNDKQNPEVIFSINFDGEFTRTWGGMTFIIHAAVGGDMSAADFGIDGGWAGTRTTSALVDKFTDITGATDERAMFFTEGQTKEIVDFYEFNNGFAIAKFKNINAYDTLPPSNPTFVDSDFPVFRLADAHLMYAEAMLRMGNAAEAVAAINPVRERAYGNTNGNITAGELTLDWILDERARELYWECHRRTDLVRFGKLTGNAYNWPWKGGLPEGTQTDAKYDVFPIPANDIAANPKLKQNPLYQ